MVQHEKALALSQWPALIGMGLALGWLTGLSASPVLASVLTALLGAGAGAVIGIRASRDSLSGTLDARPLALLLIAMAAAAPFAVMVRTYKVLEPRRGKEVLASSVPASAPIGAKKAEAFNVTSSTGALFSASTEDCTRIVGSPDKYFRSAVQTSQFTWAMLLANEIKDDHKLREIVNSVCKEMSLSR